MAESLVAVTPGAGKNLHTFNRTTSAGSVEDEVVLLGENYLASYTFASPTVSSTATANSHLIQIMAGASLKVRIRRIEMAQYGLATTAALMDTRIFRLTTAGTGGTTQAAVPLDPSDAAAGATSMLLPTAKGTEVAGPIAFARPYLIQTLGASTPFSNPVLVWDFDRPRSKPLIIAAGVANGIAVKNIDAVAGASVVFTIWIDESSFA